jgi:hypothetical protein
MSFWGKLGRVALKAAPIAAGFIPGIGPLASMAIGGIAAGADKKLSGGSWRDALISGGIGAGTGYASGKLGDMTTSRPGGIGPSNPTAYIGRDVADTAARALGQGGVPWGKIAMSALGAAPLLGAVGSSGGNEGQGQFGAGVYDQGPFGNFNYRNPDIGAAINRGRLQANPNARIGPTMRGY